MRWFIVGAGAIGGVVGAKLHQAGESAVLIARGQHLRAVQDRGLALHDPDGEHVLPVPAGASLEPFDVEDGDVVVLAVKTQHTAAALEQIVAYAPAGTRILCLQNGIDNERQALRFFDEVYGASVTLLASYLEPGSVVAHASPRIGTLQLGRAIGGPDPRLEPLASTLRLAGLRVDLVDDVMSYKRLKLLRNLGNAIEVVCDGAAPRLLDLLSSEAETVFAAAALTLPPADADIPGPEPVDPRVPRSGGSTLQSVLRGEGSVETDYLNGEIALLGREHGVPTPVNALLQRLAREVARGGIAPRSLPEDDLLRRLAA